jgi:agmatine/peptidylarginine deiminase
MPVLKACLKLGLHLSFTFTLLSFAFSNPTRAEFTPSPLPAFPAGVRPWTEFAHAQEIWLSLGGYVCNSVEDLVSGNWAGGYKNSPEYAQVMVQGGQQVVHIASVIADYFPVRVFVDPACSGLAAYLELHPNITVQMISIDRIWIRDFAPIWLRSRSSTRTARKADFLALDLPYFAGQPWAALADAFPSTIGKNSSIPTLPIPHPEYSLQGGDFQADVDGTCLYNHPINNPNDPSATVEQRNLGFPRLLTAMGCRRVIALDPLPSDGTGHIDMAVMIAPGKNAFVARFDRSKDPQAQAVMDSNYRKLRLAGYRLHFLKTDSPKPDMSDPKSKLLAYFSYANSLLNGNVAFVPQYGSPLDQAALETYRRAGFIAVPIRVERLALQMGAIHCVTNKSPIRLR